MPLKLGGGYRDQDTLVADLVAIVNAECRALVAAGAQFVRDSQPVHVFLDRAPCGPQVSLDPLTP